MRSPRVIQMILRRYNRHNGPLLAKGLSFNLLMGILPLIFLTFWSAAMLVDLVPELQQLLEAEFLSFLPVSMQNIVDMQIDFLGRSRDTLGFLTLLTFVVTVFFLFEALERTIRTMLGSPGRTWLKARGISLGMVFGSLLFVYAAAILSFGMRIIHQVGILDNRFLPLGAFMLTLIMTGAFFAGCELIFSRHRLKKIPLLCISLCASGVWHLVAYLSGVIVRSAGRRFIVYGAMAGAVSYSVFLRILAEIIIFATLLVRYYAIEKGDEEDGEREEKTPAEGESIPGR